MKQRKGRVATPDASRWLTRLCLHFSRKIDVTHDAHQGLAHFPWGRCRLHVDGACLCFDCDADDEEGLTQVVYVIDAHVKLFSRKQPLQVEWDTVQSA
ncbi:DUF2218 domain-containing protein [Caldimonas brevitalea]|uniref:DUF2218 domain-containing protein n=1 Tax=Caldimonas brevitalea TaxID=413882 RepID=A0A0G3BJU8_9BURK|nr:DUF2218 domain-containing protein [Caldimonas brevitalea]AKJ29744.1 hypothetical protein AAW51_3053 [Caldimonas brevitalea]